MAVSQIFTAMLDTDTIVIVGYCVVIQRLFIFMGYRRWTMGPNGDKWQHIFENIVICIALLPLKIAVLSAVGALSDFV